MLRLSVSIKHENSVLEEIISFQIHLLIEHSNTKNHFANISDQLIWKTEQHRELRYK